MILLHYFVLKMAGINFLGNSILLLLCLDWNVYLKKITVYYDQDCGFCTKSVLFLKRFTFNKKIHFLPNTSNSKLSSEKLKAAIGALDEDGQTYYASEVFEQITSRSSILYPISILFKLPGVIYLSDILYKEIARRRTSISKMIGADQCSIDD